MAKAEQEMEKKKADFKAGRAFGVSQNLVTDIPPDIP